jgi:hypothetical protein
MRRGDAALLGLSGALLLAVAIPVLAQGGPQSLLPPGFGEPDAPQPASPPPPQQSSGSSSSVDAAPSLIPPGAVNSSAALALPDLSDATTNAAEAKDPDEYDLPPTARRSLAQIGPLTPATGGVSANAYGPVRGQYLVGLMRASHAPFVSRWASIVLRRVLLSGTTTPSGVDGADLVAERAALLLRMGEADAARLLVQSVDGANYTPRLYAVAMDAYLASADPSGFCPLVNEAVVRTDDPRWQMAEAICASFSGDQGQATSFLNQAQRQGKLRGIDYRLGEKTVGAGPNSRRSVKIEWDGVGNLDTWRFGLATATNVDIPAALFGAGNDAMRAWEARAPALSAGRRLAGVAAASRLGVFSGDAQVGYYSGFADPVDGDKAPPGDLYETFRRSYAGETVGDRVQAMHAFWSMAPADGAAVGPGGVSYGALPPLARAAAALPPSAEVGADTPWLLAAMFAGGYDRNAAAWGRAVEAMDGEGKERAWALLAVGLPGAPVAASRDRVDAFVSADTSEEKIASRMLVAALAGLGRLPADQVAALSSDLGMRPAATSRWARAIAAAAARREKATVALLAAVGMQTRRWDQLPPEHLTAILAAMRSVGLEPEARMIAAEAMTRL